jgi:DNA polymerase
VLVPISKRERKIWLLDMLINLRGVAVDTVLVCEADKILRRSLRDYGRQLAEVTGGQVSSVNQVKAFKDWLLPRLNTGLAEIADESLDKTHLPLVLAGLRETHDPDDPAIRALEIRQQAAKSSTAKLAQFVNRTADDGRMRENHLYHGAGTGRWAGKGVQLQNLPRPELKQSQIDHAIRIICDTSRSIEDRADELDFLFGPIPSVISSCLRGCLVPRNGNHRFVVADYANIEGRVNAWAAGQADKVEVFRNDGPIYERMAAEIYGIEVETITKGMVERHVGKTAELGCGYQMGGAKFLQTCLDAGINTVDLEMAERVVGTYREVNHMIKKFWYGMEAVALDAMRQPGSITEYRDFKFHCTPDKSFLLMILPSGRRVYYPSPVLKKKKTPWGELKDQITYMGTDAYTRQWVRQSTYGGKLVENAVQATARDLLAAAMYRVEYTLGYPVVLTVHDEIVCDLDLARTEIDADFALEELEREMCVLPKWAAGCPVAAEGYHYGRFKK